MITVLAAPDLSDALQALSERVFAHEQGDEKNIVFCEDRLTLLAERAVLQRIGATMRTEVTTFARFLSTDRRILSKQGSVMAVASILSSLEGKLKVFGRSSSQAVYETLAQLSASRVDADMLRRGAEETEGILQNKLYDLALLSERYEAFLREKNYLDENGYLALLPEKMKELAGANVFFFAFPSFTRQALEGVKEACLVAANTEAILLGGDEEIYTNEAISSFLCVAEECGAVKRLRAPCTLSEDAVSLRASLFDIKTFSSPKKETKRIVCFNAPDETREMETVCALIKKYTTEKGLRYQDFAVLVPGKSCFLTAEKVFSAFRIPFYADKKKPYSEHPFCVFLFDVLAAAADGGTGESIDAIASSLYFGEGSEYRNYLLRYGGYRGAVNKEIKEGDAVKHFDRDALVLCREKMKSILALFPRKGRGASYVAAVRSLMELTDAVHISEGLSDIGQEFLSLDRLQTVLSEIEEIAGQEEFSAREFSSVLFGGLNAAEVSVLPRKSDAVFVGDVTESKLASFDVVFCTGLTDALPAVSQDTAVISDGEMERLSRLKVQIEPAIAVVNARARESLALNLCSFRRALYLSRPVRQGGEETRESEVLGYIKRAFTLPAMPSVFPYDCAGKEPAVLSMLRYREAYFRGRREDGSGETDGKKFSAVHAALCSEGEERLAEILLSDGEKKPVPALAELLKGDVSPTLLEKYFECPYEGFALRGLRLREREERTAIASDAGIFIHAALERIAPQFDTFQDSAECRAFAEKTAKELLSTRFSSLLDTGEGLYTGERLTRECGDVCVAAFEKLARSEFKTVGAEEEVALPELSIRGRVDRVDRSGEYVRVIDYKTGNVSDAATAYYTGQKLQLELYLLGASKGGIPAGAFYFPAADRFTKEGEERFGMRGFSSCSEEVLRRMGEEPGKKADKKMEQGEFSDFLSYALLVAGNARKEMAEGNITPSPYAGACEYCKLLGMCAFSGDARAESAIKCKEIAQIARETKQ